MEFAKYFCLYNLINLICSNSLNELILRSLIDEHSVILLFELIVFGGYAFCLVNGVFDGIDFHFPFDCTK